MTYSTAISPFLHSSEFATHRIPYATISSTIFVGAHIIFLGLVIPFSVITNFRFDSSIIIAKTLGEMLASGSAAFDAGRFDTVSELTTSIEELTGTLKDHFSEFVFWWRATFAVYAGMTGALVVVSFRITGAACCTTDDRPFPDLQPFGLAALFVSEESHRWSERKTGPYHYGLRRSAEQPDLGLPVPLLHHIFYTGPYRVLFCDESPSKLLTIVIHSVCGHQTSRRRGWNVRD